MAKVNRDITKSKRAPVTGKPFLVRLQPDLEREVDAFRRKECDKPSVPEAIRRLTQRGLKK